MSFISMNRIADFLLRFRSIILAFFFVLTLFFLYSSLTLTVNQGFDQQLPKNHAMIDVFKKYRADFGGANKILIALHSKEGTIFTSNFMTVLKQLTDEMYYLPYVDRERILSLFTPNARFIEVVEDGFTGGNLIPADFQPTSDYFEIVKSNIVKSQYLGFLVSKDFTSAMISIDLGESKNIDYVDLSSKLDQLRVKYTGPTISMHMIGFTKILGSLSNAKTSIFFFFGLSVLMTIGLLYFYLRSFLLPCVLVLTGMIAVVWQFGLMSLFHFWLDPYSILLPFLIFAIAVSHGLQMVNKYMHKVRTEKQSQVEAAHQSFKELFFPGSMALLTDGIGFLAIDLIPIPILQNLAYTASIGIACILIVNLFLLPMVLSFCSVKSAIRLEDVLINYPLLWMEKLLTPSFRYVLFLMFIFLFAVSYYKAGEVKIGDQDVGTPEFHKNSPYNQDVFFINDKFNIGIDTVQIYARTEANGCIQYPIVKEIDKFEWYLRGHSLVTNSYSLPNIMKRSTMGWNEGFVKWHALVRNKYVLVRSISSIETSSGLLNEDCSVMPITLYVKDHKYETIESIYAYINSYVHHHQNNLVHFDVGGGSLTVLKSVNDVVSDSQFRIVFGIYLSVFIICYLSFRSLIGVISILLPLVLVSFMTNALMSVLEIGLKISTLPIAALGVGIGVDYGIYLYAQLQRFLKEGNPFVYAYRKAIQTTGAAIFFTGITLSFSTMIWYFSPLKFQSDMGCLLSFMFFANMLGALIFLPIIHMILDQVKNWIVCIGQSIGSRFATKS